MWSRLGFWLIAVFWLTMGVLLWRSEFGGGASGGASVPVSMVWHKILTAPDNSTLEIRQGTNRIGLCRWSANLGQEQATGARLTEDQPEGMVRTLSNYTLDVDGNFTQAELGGRVRFGCTLVLSTNHAWQEFHLRLNLRPDAYAVHAHAATESVRLVIDDENGHAVTRYTFAELRNPQKILKDLGGPLLPATITALGVPLSTNQTAALSSPIRWEAHQDWLLLGRTRLRTYRLNGHLFDRFEVVVHVSPVGEILRVELPGKIFLINEAVGNIRPPSK